VGGCQASRFLTAAEQATKRWRKLPQLPWLLLAWATSLVTQPWWFSDLASTPLTRGGPSGGVITKLDWKAGAESHHQPPMLPSSQRPVHVGSAVKSRASSSAGTMEATSSGTASSEDVDIDPFLADLEAAGLLKRTVTPPRLRITVSDSTPAVSAMSVAAATTATATATATAVTGVESGYNRPSAGSGAAAGAVGVQPVTPVIAAATEWFTGSKSLVGRLGSNVTAALWSAEAEPVVRTVTRLLVCPHEMVPLDSSRILPTIASSLRSSGSNTCARVQVRRLGFVVSISRCVLLRRLTVRVDQLCLCECA
jgi:hypothetical protein